jgi:hypothetical protein
VATHKAVMRMEPPNYDPSSIRRVRPPEVEGEVGCWHALWLLKTTHPISVEKLHSVETEVSATIGVKIRLTRIADSDIRLETFTAVHPLDLEAWPVIDSMLLDLHRLLGLAEVNDCPREWWRPFR